MKIRARLAKSLDALIQTVMPLADGDRLDFLKSLRQWYVFHLGGIHNESQRGDGLGLLLNTQLDEIAVTTKSITQVRSQLARYRSGDRPEHDRIARRSELVAAGVIEEAT